MRGGSHVKHGSRPSNDLVDVPDLAHLTQHHTTEPHSRRYYFSYPSEWKVETVNKVCSGAVDTAPPPDLPCDTQAGSDSG